jgi:hypothetical protein
MTSGGKGEVETVSEVVLDNGKKISNFISVYRSTLFLTVWKEDSFQSI